MSYQDLATRTLVSGIQRIADQTGRHIRQDVDSEIVELLGKYGNLPAIHDYVSYFGHAGLVATIRNVWHRRFEQGLKLIYEPKSQTRVLCAFGSVVDRVYILDSVKLRDLEQWCLKHSLNQDSPGSTDP